MCVHVVGSVVAFEGGTKWLWLHECHTYRVD